MNCSKPTPCDPALHLPDTEHMEALCYAPQGVLRPEFWEALEPACGVVACVPAAAAARSLPCSTSRPAPGRPAATHSRKPSTSSRRSPTRCGSRRRTAFSSLAPKSTPPSPRASCFSSSHSHAGLNWRGGGGGAADPDLRSAPSFLGLSALPSVPCRRDSYECSVLTLAFD